MWVQEHASNQTFIQQRLEVLSGQLLGQLQLIVAVVDPVKWDKKNKPVTYTEALVELFRWRNGG